MTISNTRVQVKAEFGQNYKDLGTVGRIGENDSREIVFDCSDVLTHFSGASIVCVIKRACDTTPYSAPLMEDGYNRILPLSAVENAAAGQIMIELRAVSDDTILKSAMFSGRIAESLQGEGDRPGNPTADTLNRLESTLAAAKEIGEELTALVDKIQTMLDNGDFIGPQCPKGDTGATGPKGDPGKKGDTGATGPQGVSGVYVGSGDMPEGYNVQIDPSGTATE